MKYGLFASAFSPFPHMGHISIMEQAVAGGHCDSIFALLHADPSIERPNKRCPPLSVIDRSVLLHALRRVTRLAVYHTEKELHGLYAAISATTPCCLIVGEQYKAADYVGRDLNIPVFFPKEPPWHGADIIRTIHLAYIDHENRTSDNYVETAAAAWTPD